MANFRFTSNRREIEQMTATLIERGLTSVGLLAEDKAVQLSPVDTGRLRSSITHVVDDGVVVIGSNVDYAPHIEFGTSRSQPQPFIRPAIQNYRKDYIGLLASILREGMR